MSNLSDFLQKPYPGLTVTNPVLIYSRPSQATFLLESTDAAEAGAAYPQIVLRNSYQAVGSGGAIYGQTKNSGGANVYTSFLSLGVLAITAGAEEGRAQLGVLRTGGFLTVALRGDVPAFMPETAGAIDLGVAATPWRAIYTGDGTRSLSLTADATAAKIASGGGVGIEFRPNGTAKAFMAVSGTFTVGLGQPGAPTSEMMTVTGNHPSIQTTIYGFRTTYTVPSSATVKAIGLGVTLATAAAAFTCTDVIGVNVGPGSTGAGSVITNYTGIYFSDISAGVNNFAMQSPMTQGTGKFGLYFTGNVEHLLTGSLGLGGRAQGGSPESKLYAVTADSAQNGVTVYSSQAANWTGTLLSVSAANAGSAASGGMLSISQGTKSLVINGSMQMLYGTGATVVDNALINIAGGRLRMAYHNTAEISGFIAETLQIQGTATPGLNTNGRALAVKLTVDAGSGPNYTYGVYTEMAISALPVSCQAAAVRTVIDVGTAVGVVIANDVQISAQLGHSGAFYGARHYLSGQAASVVYGEIIQWSGTLVSGVRLSAISADQPVTTGFYLTSSGLLTGAAYRYDQRAGSTGKFLHYVDSGSADRFVVDYLGDMTFGGIGRRLRADMSDAAFSNRFSLQTSITNAFSFFQVLPNGTGSSAGMVAINASDPTNACRAMFYASNTASVARSAATGTGTELPFRIVTAAAQYVCAEAHINGDLAVGSGLSGTAATSGHVYLPSVAGVMTGVPTARSGFVPLCYDATNNKLGVYNGGAWKWSGAFA